MWAVNQWREGEAEGVRVVRGEEKREGEQERKCQTEREEKRRTGRSECIRRDETGKGGGREGGRVGGASLTSTWFNIRLYSVLRASRVTRTRPS